MNVQAVAKNEAAVIKLERNLRDEQHRVLPAGGQQDTSVPGYNWAFGLDVQVTQPAANAEAKP